MSQDLQTSLGIAAVLLAYFVGMAFLAWVKRRE
jgi:hypothetical protein